MKWRSSVIYLIVLALLGGYYYYFEIVQKEQRESAERKAKRVFSLEMQDIKGLEIVSKDKRSVQLSKKGNWRITKPIDCEADQSTMEGLLDTLVTLQSERNVAEKAKDLKRYGLGSPALAITVERSGKSTRLLLGDMNPTGDGYYAKISDKSDIFLISEGVWGVLDKGLDELRRRELCAFEPESVVALSVAWKDGHNVSVERKNLHEPWESTNHPAIKISGEKVGNVLDQLRWLRAKKFIENKADNFAANGLAPPQATVTVQLTEGRSVELLLGEKESDAEEVTAASSELPAVVTIPADILENMPNSIGALQDRSLLSLKSDEVTGVKWHLGDARGDVVRTDVNKWGWFTEGQDPHEMKDSWKVSALVYDLIHAEYLKKVDPMPGLPARPHGRLDFFNKDKKLASIIWGDPQSETAKATIVWIESGENPAVAVTVHEELLRRVEEDLTQLASTKAP